MFKRILFLICIPFISLFANEPIIDAPPSWVTECSFSLEPVPLKETQVNLQYLLFETQRNWEEKTTYCRFALKPLTELGVDDVSQIIIDYDPSDTSVIVHSIFLYRNGKVYDRLENSHYKIIQRESELESNIYRGNFSLIYFLDDVRQDDIIEYSYSLVDHNSLFNTHFSEFFLFQFGIDVEKIAHRFLVHPARNFYLKTFNTTLEPSYKDLSSDLCEWSWEINDASPPSYDFGAPSWYYPYAHAQISQYENWNEVAKKLTPLYTLSEDFQPSSEMQELLTNWASLTSDPKELALLALRFVQDEVRYLGLEDGIGGYKPRDPNLVLQRRYGDCKDKSFLLHALLNSLGISSTPALVHVDLGKELPSDLPAPRLFDHVILLIQIDGVDYWVDSTAPLQGGNLANTFCPNLHWALLVRENTHHLKQIISQELQAPNVVIDTTISLASEDFADLTITTTHTGHIADDVRRSIKWDGVKATSDDMLEEIQKLYPGATRKKALTVSDDRQSNTVAIVETYRVPTRKRSGKKMLNIYSTIVQDALDLPADQERDSPYELAYPLWLQEHVHIDNPFMEWEEDSVETTFEHESLFFSHSREKQTHSADFYFELKHLNDHVSTESFPEYFNIANDIDDEGQFVITIVPPKE